MSMRRKLAVVAFGAAAFTAFRRWHQRWGATDEEAGVSLRGDELVDHPSFQATRAISIQAPPEDVWPWLVQIGYGRAGFYAYDLLDNLGHGRSAERIRPELQHLEVGDWIPMAPNVNETTAFQVHSIEPNRWMVWRQPNSTWSWRLDPEGATGTRLIERLRVRYRFRSPLIVSDLILMELGDFPMMRRQLLGLKRRAESARVESDRRTTAMSENGGEGR
jgi:hypothetical protein